MAGSEIKADVWVNEYITPWDIYSHGVSRILFYERSEYQEIYIVESGTYGKGLVLDGKWQSCTGEEFIYHETLVQPAAIAHGSPRSVLILGGGEGATAREALRWKTVERVVTIDIDRAVIEACRQHLPEMHQNAFDDPRSEIIIGDALEVLDRTQQGWDIIISDLSDPIEEGPSFQLFTQEYFQKIKRSLNPGGYAVIQSGPVAPPLVAYHARLINTLKTVFNQVQPLSASTAAYGSPWGYALCSDSEFSTRPDPESVDRLLAAKTTGGLRYIDGATLLRVLQPPLYIRAAIAQETTIYTAKEPPKFFGKGVATGA